MDLDTFEIKAKLVQRIKQINEQVSLLNTIGEKLCTKEHCEIGFEVKLTDKLEKQKHEATVNIDRVDYGWSSMPVNWRDQMDNNYVDGVTLKFCDKSAIGLIGTLIKELETERKLLLEQLENE